MDKKAQAQVIVTVLIILIVLGIIGFVGVMVTRTVREGAEQAEKRSDCLDIRLSIAEAIANSSVKIERQTGGPSNVSVNIYIDGNLSENIAVNELETKSGSVNLSLGNVVQIAAVTDIGLCDFADEKTVA